MKMICMLWIMTAGVGISYAIYEERQHRLKLLCEMEKSLEKLAYFMYDWRMSTEEAFVKILKEPFPNLMSLFLEILEEIRKREVINLGVLWKQKSSTYFETTTLEKDIKETWCDLFLNIPMEPEDLKRSILGKRDHIKSYLGFLQDKYKEEQKLVWTLGLCASAFLCLIIC